MIFFGKIARLTADSPVRQRVFQPDSFEIVAPLQRKVGRPRQEWSRELQMKIEKMIQDLAARRECIKKAEDWKTEIWTFIEFLKKQLESMNGCQCAGYYTR